MGDKQKRYPSIRAFQKQEASLFIGRDQEKKLLYNKIVAGKMVLLFARSGIGKSSLINAGLIPMLEDRGFLPLDIRLTSSDDPTDTPLLIFKKLLVHYLDKEKYDNLLADVLKTYPDYQPGLWEYFKCCTFPLATTPVLIFDQFEQFFSFTVPEQDEFMEQFRNIVADTPPAECIDWLHDLAGTELREKYAPFLSQPDLHVLFAIRSDKIFEMNRLSQIISNILRNRFELYPLQEEEAKKAICIPASAKNSYLYQSLPFAYDPVLIENIIIRLKGGNDIIETTQLQIICSEIENRIILGPDGEPDKPEGYVVTETDLKNTGGIENIVSHFYQNQVKKMGDEKYQELARILIEDNLFDKDARNRKLAFKEAVVNILNQGKDKLNIKELNTDQFINKLLGLRLIREDYRENKKFYEISHDYLLNAITESFETREAKRLAEANADLERNNELLRKLKDKAEKAEETAKLKQEEAEKASREALRQQALTFAAKEEADKNYQIASVARLKVEKLKKRNERLGIAIFLIGIIGIIYLVRQNGIIISEKRKTELLSKRATKGIISIFNAEAEKRYNAGDRIVAYALWDSARSYSPDDTSLSNKLANLPYPPFTGGTSLITDIQVSKSIDYVGVRYSNSQCTVWKIDDKKDEIEEVLSLPNISSFLILPNDKIIIIDTTYIPYYINLNTAGSVHYNLPVDTSKINKIVFPEGSDFVILEEKNGEANYFYSLDNLEPSQELNKWHRNQVLRGKSNVDIDPSDYEFHTIDKDNLVISMGNTAFYLYQTGNKTGVFKLALPANTGIATGNKSKKIAYNADGVLTIFDVFTRKSSATDIQIGKYDRPRDFFCDDSLILVEHYKEQDAFTSSSFSMYNIGKSPLRKRVVRRSLHKGMDYNKDMNLIGFLDTANVFILFDVAMQRMVYPTAPSTNEFKVRAFGFYQNSDKIYLKTDNGMTILTRTANGGFSEKAGNGNLPIAVYGDKFYKAREIKGRKFVLLFQDTTKNNIKNLQAVFRKYINKEIAEAISD